MKLYFHPVSSYSQKTLMGLYEMGIAFEPVVVDLMNPAAKEEYRKVHPLGKVPYLVDEERDWQVPESSIILEYAQMHKSPKLLLIPSDPELSRQVRLRDRMVDQYINNPMTTVFFDGMRSESEKDPRGVKKARETLDTMYQLLDRELSGKQWAMGDLFSLVDCAAASPLFYCRMVYSFAAYPNLSAYVERLLARPSMARVLTEAAPYLAAFASKP